MFLSREGKRSICDVRSAATAAASKSFIVIYQHGIVCNQQVEESNCDETDRTVLQTGGFLICVNHCNDLETRLGRAERLKDCFESSAELWKTECATLLK